MSSPRTIERALITGATGFLGRALLQRLDTEGIEAHLLVRPESDISSLGSGSIHVHDGGQVSMSALVKAARPDIVYHLATCYRRLHSPDDVQQMIDANVGLGTQLLEAMRLAGHQRIVTLGSFFQYDDHDAYRPVNLYAATKQAFDDIACYFEDAHGFEITRLVLYDIYGEHDTRRKFMNAVLQAVRNGHPVALPERDMTVESVHVDDVVDALLHVGRAGISGGPYSIATDQPTTLDAIVAVFERIAGKSIERNWGAFPPAGRDPETPWRGELLPGWSAKVSLEDGIRRLLGEGAGDAR